MCLVDLGLLGEGTCVFLVFCIHLHLHCVLLIVTVVTVVTLVTLVIPMYSVYSYILC